MPFDCHKIVINFIMVERHSIIFNTLFDKGEDKDDKSKVFSLFNLYFFSLLWK